jgi:hypothetical protein
VRVQMRAAEPAEKRQPVALTTDWRVTVEIKIVAFTSRTRLRTDRISLSCGMRRLRRIP